MMRSGHIFRAGDWVEVRPFNEVLATLDDRGCLDALPFMPEMVRFCGQRLRVVKSAHKTCDPTGCSDLRRMTDAVHLETRCDGTGHGGCEARCLLFWKTAWLIPVDGPGPKTARPTGVDSADLDRLQSATRSRTPVDGEIRYRCQATEIVQATTALPSSDVRQYIEDVARRNISLATFVRCSAIAITKMIASRLFRLVGLRRNGRTPPPRNRAPESLDLAPGELVQVRPPEEIMATLNDEGKNRGLSFEKEMLRYSGGTYRVLCRVNQIIDEKSGKMIRLMNDCIMLEGLCCAGLENRSRLFCPRSPYFYWREAWLRRVGDGDNRHGAAP
jgi:hypothetical protein